MDLEVPEAPGERHVTLGRERLVAEEEDLVVGEGLADFGHDVVGQLGPEVDAGDLPADGGPERPGVEVAPAQRGQPVPLGGDMRVRPDGDLVSRKPEQARPGRSVGRAHW